MQVTTDLRGPFSYNFSIITIILTLIIAIILFKYVYYFILNGQAPRIAIKSLYLSKLDALKKEVENNTNDMKIVKKSYVKLSALIREFVYKKTGIRVHTQTLNEIKRHNMPALIPLVEEYYKVEFTNEADQTAVDIIASLEKTREVIKKW